MNPKKSLLATLATASALCLSPAFQGCNVVPPAQEDSTRYFILSDPGSAGRPAGQAAGSLRIGIKAVVLEGYLKHREMIVRTGEHEVAFRDYRRWAESLDSAIFRIVQASVQASPAVAEVDAQPFPFDQRRDYDVALTILRCEGAESSSGKFTASFSALIEISTAGDGAHVVGRRVFTAPASAWDGENFDQLAGLLSQDAAALGRDILAGIPQ